MKIHLIAIGGSAMHNMALALQKKGYEVTGSDDAIFDPSRADWKRQVCFLMRWVGFLKKSLLI